MTYAPADFAVDADIRRAQTLPAAAFRERDFLSLELLTIFRQAWLLAPEPGVDADPDGRGLAELTAQRGARLPLSLAGAPIYLQRGWDDDQLRGFPNLCTHAWYPMVLGASRGPTLVCGQHGRKFDCAGRFVAHTGFAGLPDFPGECDHLAPLAVEVWRRLVFASFAPRAPWREAFAELVASTAGLPLEESRRSRTVAEAREVAGNWKQHAWNYMDRFHVAFIHRAPGGLAEACDLSTYQTELHGDAALQWAYARNPDDGFAPELLPARFRDPADPEGTRRRVFALWWFVFPNLTLNFYPWGLSVNIYEPVPERPDATLFRWYHLVSDEARYARREEGWLMSQVDAEDLDAMAQVRRSLRGSELTRPPRGRFAPVEEVGPHWFHHRVSRALFG